MFLKILEDENKTRFLTLCIHAALSNGVFAEKEKEMIHTYCQEMAIPEMLPDASGSLDALLADIAAHTNDIEKNIIILEILGLVRSDGVYDKHEQEFMTRLTNGINAKEGLLSRLNSLLEIYTTVCKELYTAIYE